MREYRGKTVVITGAGSGIGRALAEAFTDHGARLALSDVNPDGLAETVEHCERHGVEVRGYHLDVADRDAIYDHAQQVATDFGTVDVVINNAGVAVHGPLAATTDADLEWIVNINFWGVVHGTRAFLPYLTASGDGQLANVSSVFGLIAAPKDAAYNATKFAVRGFTESLRQELRVNKTPVAVSCIHPGGIRTDIARSGRVVGDEPAAVQRLFDKVAFTSPEQAAKTIIGGLRQDRARILVGPDAWLIAAMPRLLGPHYGVAVETAARVLHI